MPRLIQLHNIVWQIPLAGLIAWLRARQEYRQPSPADFGATEVGTPLNVGVYSGEDAGRLADSLERES